MSQPGSGEPPAGPPVQQPPAGGGGEVPDDADDLGDPDELDGDQGEAEWERKFRDLANRLDTPGGVLPNNPEDLRRRLAPVPMPPESELAANPETEAVVERLLQAHGPLGFKEIHTMLGAGGGWGPAITMSTEGLRLLLRRVDWIAERKSRTPYNHRDNVS